MNPILRNILVVIGGIIIGSIVNMGIIMLGSSLVSPPAGVDPNDMESLKTGIRLYEARHYIFPLLAHALGTLAGAFFAARFGASRQLILAMVVGLWFLIGGITTAYMLGTPALPTAIDLIFAYIPMAWIGWKIAVGGRKPIRETRL